MASNNESGDDQPGPSHGGFSKRQKTGRKFRGAALYTAGYSNNKTAWKQAYGFVSQSSVSDQHIFCLICKKDVSIAHQGVSDIKRHAESKVHKNREAGLKNQPTLSFKAKSDPLHEKVKYFLYTIFLLERCMSCG